MPAPIASCNGTYVRSSCRWTYWWGDPVPGATDLTLGDLLRFHAGGGVERLEQFRPLTDAERAWLQGDQGAIDEVVLATRDGARPTLGDLIVSLSAPELHVLALLTVGDLADAAGVSKPTIDSYRHRGYLPPPQVVRGRTPLWSRPVVTHWLAQRPGAGWRTDLYDLVTGGLRERLQPASPDADAADRGPR